MDLHDEIEKLINLKTEGDYWDFKSIWHKNKADLLHDIICMANNLADRDAYLIIGVSDSKHTGGVQIKGVTEENRKNQQNVIDFLKTISFAGGIRPTVYVQTLVYGEQNVDVIIIKNTRKTPFFLTKPYNDGGQCVCAGYIYTRIGDTNTAKKEFADLDKIEYLWRKRLGIDLTVNEKLLMLLDSPDDWIGDFNYEERKYHSIYPEFQIIIKEVDDQREFQENSIIENIAVHQSDKKIEGRKLEINYHATTLYERTVIYLDGYRKLIPLPQTSTIQLGDYIEPDMSMTYLYFDHSNLEGKLFNCLSQCEHNWYGEKWLFNPGVAFLQFADGTDREKFEIFGKEKLPALLEEYNQALTACGYEECAETEEYYRSGWTKGDEIKAWQLYEMYRGIPGKSIEKKLPQIREK